MVQQCGGGGFAIGAGDGGDARIGVAAGKFQFPNDFNACLTGPLNGGGGGRDAR